jgi:hypothetical protein
MARPMKPARFDTVDHVDRAIEHLIQARDFLKGADAPQALERVRLALSSAYGARRHAERRTVIHD